MIDKDADQLPSDIVFVSGFFLRHMGVAASCLPTWDVAKRNV